MDEHEEHEVIEGHAGEGYLDVMSDPAHVMAEMTYEVFFFILSTVILAWKLRRRDRKHGHEDGAHDHAVAHGQALHDDVERSMRGVDDRRQAIDALGGQEWDGLRLLRPVDLDRVQFFTVRINDDRTFSITPDRD